MLPLQPAARVLVLAAVALAVSAPARAHAGDAPSDPRVLWLHSVHLDEQLRLQPFGPLGLPRTVPWLRLRRLFRSHRTGQARPIHPRLLRVLAQIQRHFGGRRLELLSGYRVPECRDRLSSYHQVGRAADLFIAGVPDRELFDYCRTLANVGCGFYPAGHHVHVDIRSRATVWVDLSRYGEGARYVQDPTRWLLEHPREQPEQR